MHRHDAYPPAPAVGYRKVPRMPSPFRHLLQHEGFFLRREAFSTGISDRQLGAAVQADLLCRVRHGAYAEPEYVASLSETDLHLLRLRAVLRAARGRLVASHITSLVLHGAPMWELCLDEVHVVRPSGRCGRHEAGVFAHGERLESDDVVRRRGIATTCAARAAVELLSLVDVAHALPVLDWLLHHRRTTREELLAYAARLTHRPGSLASELAIHLADERAESVGESVLRYLCYRAGLPPPQVNYEIRDARGRVVARVDLAWPELGIFIEFDGREKYLRWARPGESAADVVLREKRREELVVGLTGWRCLRVVWADLQQPERTVAWIRSVLEGAPVYDNPLCPR